MKNQFFNLLISLIALSCFILVVKKASAQGTETSVLEMFRDQDDGPDMFRRQDDANQSNDLDRRHDSNEINGNSFNSRGKPCITLSSYATAQLINKNIYEHWIKASSSCGQNIKIQVCYHKTKDCIVMAVPPYESKNSVLGIQPKMKEFQYDAEEK
jgi:hypothetical protein